MTSKVLVGPNYETDLVLIGNIHLEAGKWESDSRARQEDMITRLLFPMLSQTSGVFLAGDFASDPTWRKERQNWDGSLFIDTFNQTNSTTTTSSSKSEQSQNDNNHSNDSIIELQNGVKTNGATYLAHWDGNKPKNNEPNEPLPEFYCRFDRVCYNSQQWKVTSQGSDIFGETSWQNQATPDSNIVYPSDHLGVKASFQRQL